MRLLLLLLAHLVAGAVSRMGNWKKELLVTRCKVLNLNRVNTTLHVIL